MTGTPIVRLLTGADATPFQAIRLRSLKEHPEAFASAYEDEKDIPVEKAVERLNQPTTERFMLGAFVDDELVGIVGGYHDTLRKCKHRAHIAAMYVTPETRGRGVGRLLLSEAVSRLTAMDGVEDVTLAVTVGNETAYSLYKSVGFETAYTEPRFFKIDGRYYDIDWMILRVEAQS